MKVYLNEQGVANLLIPLVLAAGILVGVYLVTAGPLNLFPKASVFRPSTPETSLTLTSNERNVGVGNTVAVSLIIRSDVAATNLYTAKISFEKESLIVEKIDYTGSFIKNWVEQYHDNSTGKVSLVGGVPNPGFKSNRSEAGVVMATIYFRALKAGSTKVVFEKDSMVFDNASNLNILTATNDAKVAISPRGVVEVVNVLDYFISKHQDKGLTGTHPFSQTIDGNASHYVKWDDKTFEVHTWDENYIYLHEDHSGAPVNFYGLKPGIWLKRYMQIGEKITQQSNKIEWFDLSCKKASEQTFPIEITLEQKINGFDLGGDLGKQDVIVVKYDSSLLDPNGIFERFYYSKEWGWVLWEEYSKKDASKPKNKSIFNKITSNPIKPNKAVACIPILNSSPAPTDHRRVFITSTTYDGNLGGLEGADAKCQARADAANLKGQFKAWLSDGKVSAASRLEHAPIAYKRIDGEKVASSWDDLVTRIEGVNTGKTLNPINKTEFGEYLRSFTDKAWTDTKTDGQIHLSANDANCVNWTSADSITHGMTGDSRYSHSAWTENDSVNCSAAMHLYCFEQKEANLIVKDKGDGNNDGRVDLGDISVLLSGFNKEVGSKKNIDLNGDNKINTFDFSLMRNLLIQKKVIRG